MDKVCGEFKYHKKRSFCIFVKNQFMFTTILKENIFKHKTEGYKLCYIDEIPETYSDWSPETLEWMKTDEYKRLRAEREAIREAAIKEKGYYTERYDWNDYYNQKHVLQDYPNEDFVRGKQEFYAYFTPMFLDEQWGDDWDDAPYEHNAGVPYDDIILESKPLEKFGNLSVVTKKKEYEIIRVPFYIPSGGWDVMLPKDWGGLNSPFCVRDINAGAVAWIFARGPEGKSSGGAISILAGCSPEEFAEKIGKINEMYPYVPEDEEEE